MLPLASIMQRTGSTPASDPGALKVTISKFYRPSGNSTQLRGVRADIVLPSFTDIPEISEGGMKNPLEWDTAPAALFAQFDLVKPYLRDLARSFPSSVWPPIGNLDGCARIWRSSKQMSAAKSVSLNEAERRREQAEAAARTKARHAELLAHPDSAPPVYEITVKNASAPGLPAPLDPENAKTQTSAPQDESSDAPELGFNRGHSVAGNGAHSHGLFELLNQSSTPALTER